MNEPDRTLFDDFLEELRIKPITTYSESECRELVDAKPGYRNGYGKERKLTLSS